MSALVTKFFNQNASSKKSFRKEKDTDKNSMTKRNTKNGKHDNRKPVSSRQQTTHPDAARTSTSRHVTNRTVTRSQTGYDCVDGRQVLPTITTTPDIAKPVCRPKRSFLEAEYKTLRRKKLCYECSQEDSRILALPCRHLVLCEGCQEVLQCPVCGDDILGTVKVFFA